MTRESEVVVRLAEGKTYQSIADTFGVSRQRVQQIAVKLGVKSINPRGIRPWVKEKRSAERPGGALGILWDEAVRRGFEVKGVVGESGKPDRTRLWINGKLCALHQAMNTFSPKGSKNAKYHRVNCPTDRVNRIDFRIVMAGASWFIFPAGVLKGDGRQNYLPDQPAQGYHGLRSRIDWEEYRGAWGRIG